MLYQSTRGHDKKITAAEAIVRGLAVDGGLFVPESFPLLTENDIIDIAKMPYRDRAAYIMGMYLTDFDADELKRYTAEAYNDISFGGPAIAPLYKLDDSTHFLELWHGPTSAFKDMALQILPMLMKSSLRKTNLDNEVCVLVATSGDTGKAALEGFCDVPGTRIMVFYPIDGVSEVQKLQMTSQSGSNVNVVAVKGNFDNAQTGVKSIFSNEDLRIKLRDMGIFLSSANSINCGRLVPQIVYYFSTYCELLNKGDIKCGDKVNFCVPTGNFGNILAGYYSMRMGLPINKLICASNQNDVLAQFLSTGIYDRKRPFFTTASPSMDILVSSNLERLLYELSGKDGSIVSGYMRALADMGAYEVPAKLRDEAGHVFHGGFCGERETLRTIAETFERHNYLIDTHTAVAYSVLDGYRKATGDKTPSVVVSTASPYKFCESVLDGLGKPIDTDGIGLVDTLFEATNVPIPEPLSKLKTSKPRFNDVVSTDEMEAAVKEFCGERS